MARIPRPAIQKFYKDYQAAYGTPPENAFAALGYDTLGLIADAIKRAGSEDPPRDPRRASPPPRAMPASPARSPSRRTSACRQKTVAMIGVKDEKLFLAEEVTPSFIPAP